MCRLGLTGTSNGPMWWPERWVWCVGDIHCKGRVMIMYRCDMCYRCDLTTITANCRHRFHFRACQNSSAIDYCVCTWVASLSLHKYQYIKLSDDHQTANSAIWEAVNWIKQPMTSGQCGTTLQTYLSQPINESTNQSRWASAASHIKTVKNSRRENK